MCKREPLLLILRYCRGFEISPPPLHQTPCFLILVRRTLSHPPSPDFKPPFLSLLSSCGALG